MVSKNRGKDSSFFLTRQIHTKDFHLFIKNRGKSRRPAPNKKIKLNPNYSFTILYRNIFLSADSTRMI